MFSPILIYPEMGKINFQNTIGTRIVFLDRFTIFTTVFHRILDFKNGAGFLSWPLFFFIRIDVLPLNVVLTMEKLPY